MYKAYRFRMYPNEEQKILIEKHIGSCRFVWNHFLDMRNRRYTEIGKGMTYKQTALLLPALKKEYPWLNEVNSQSIQQVIMHLDSAFHRFFKKIGEYPVFKKKRHSGSFTVPQHFSIEDNHLTIPKFNTPIRFFKHREIEGMMRSLTITKKQSGKYYVSILADTEIQTPEPRNVKSESSAGMDVGITEFLTLSDGIQIGNPKNIEKSERKLAKRQRQMAKKKKGSKNRNKARIKIATIEEHIANQRMDFHDKVSDTLTRQYDTIITEDLNVSGMMKNHHLARSISDAGWSSFFTMLKTKAMSRGKNIIEIGRFDPSSKMCSHCGYIYELKLCERSWTCPECHTRHDRELNAAI
ncbi:MAG: RNA-guided endonuclease TnpB family protein, partial [Thermoplasmataceae archaeon]